MSSPACSVTQLLGCLAAWGGAVRRESPPHFYRHNRAVMISSVTKTSRNAWEVALPAPQIRGFFQIAFLLSFSEEDAASARGLIPFPGGPSATHIQS